MNFNRNVSEEDSCKLTKITLYYDTQKQIF